MKEKLAVWTGVDTSFTHIYINEIVIKKICAQITEQIPLINTKTKIHFRNL